ncbi:uncharacterized protein LOC127137345 [Lathyrus oleraceus]|uniref:uncharacterized protein LOC127137345 n=1 Tax=Pisum sativum TaxID=3888 RepID=UPI0021D06727|nr:uncharacterized protein LOC127137345 [Pisum sativum]
MFKVKWKNEAPFFHLDYLGEPAYYLVAEDKADGHPWYYDIMKLLESQEYPENTSITDKNYLRKQSAKFFLSGWVLYKRKSDSILLRCVNKQEANEIIMEIHEGSFGTHASGHTMVKKILRVGYYWMNMEIDCYCHVQTCHKCQIYADKIHVPLVPLNVLTSPWPFSIWGIDVIRCIEPTSSNGHRFILVAIDYFTKGVEAVSYANLTRQVVTRFLKKEIICHYGVPNKTITDNGSNLNNKLLKDLCTNFMIEHHNSSPYRPKMNVEVEIPSLRISTDIKLNEVEWVQDRFDQLNLIKEKRLATICHDQLYQNRIKRAHDNKVFPRNLKAGNLILRKILLIQTDPMGKWMLNYEGPYVIRNVFSRGALILTTMDREDLPFLVNTDAVKKYYV